MSFGYPQKIWPGSVPARRRVGGIGGAGVQRVHEEAGEAAVACGGGSCVRIPAHVASIVPVASHRLAGCKPHRGVVFGDRSGVRLALSRGDQWIVLAATGAARVKVENRSAWVGDAAVSHDALVDCAGTSARGGCVSDRVVARAGGCARLQRWRR